MNIRSVFKFLHDIRQAVEPVAGEVLDTAGVGQGGQLGINGHPGQQLQTVGLGGGLGFALAEEGDLLAAVGAEEVCLLYTSPSPRD